MKKYIPSIIIFGLIGWLAAQGLGLFEPKHKVPEPYASMTEADLEKEQQSIFEEAESMREKRERMGKIWDELPSSPEERRLIKDDFFTSRGTTKEEFLEYYEMTERQLYKR